MANVQIAVLASYLIMFVHLVVIIKVAKFFLRRKIKLTKKSPKGVFPLGEVLVR